MSNTYEMVLEEIYRRPFVVKANSVEEAYEIANEMMNNGEVEVLIDHFHTNNIISCDQLDEEDIK